MQNDCSILRKSKKELFQKLPSVEKFDEFAVGCSIWCFCYNIVYIEGAVIVCVMSIEFLKPLVCTAKPCESCT